MAAAWLPYAAGAVSIGYPLLSAYYLRHPLARLCHPPMPSLLVRTSAHRGGAAERPENSMAAFEHCVNHAKTDLLELDVHLTADGQVVVYHDQTVNRLAEDGGEAEELRAGGTGGEAQGSSSTHEAVRASDVG